jgi:hypothetical protein
MRGIFRPSSFRAQRGIPRWFEERFLTSQTPLGMTGCGVDGENVGGPTFKVLLEVPSSGEIESKTCNVSAPATADKPTFPFWNFAEVSA